MKFSIKDFFSKCDQIRSFLRIWSHLLKKFWMESFIFLCSDKAVSNTMWDEILHKSKDVFSPLWKVQSEVLPRLIWTKSQIAKLMSILPPNVILNY